MSFDIFSERSMSIQLFDRYQNILTAAPINKLTWMILALAIEARCKALTLVQTGNDEYLKITMDGEGGMVPPPRHLSLAVFNALLRVGDDAARNPDSCFGYTCEETPEGKKLEWRINYQGEQSPEDELDTLLVAIAIEENIKAFKAKRAKRNRRMVIALIIAVGIVAGIILATMFWE